MMRKLKKYKPTRFMAKSSHYDKEAADIVVGFIEQLQHTKGEFYKQPFELIDWQEQIVRDVFGILKPDGYRQFNTAYIEVPKKCGKELSFDTPIPTPDGWTTMGEIQVGDRVFDERGVPCQVTAKSKPDWSEKAYRITFKDGEVIEAGANHQWAGEYTHGKRKTCIMTTEEIAEKTYHDGCYRFRIALPEPVLYDEAVLPVDPYLMGYWLGNGNASEPVITVQTKDVPYVLVRVSKRHEVKTAWQNTGDSIKLSIPDLRAVLLESYHDKVIPLDYLLSSKEQRFCLLQGLMDSDGCINERRGQAVYTSTEKRLAESVSELLWSLGIKNAISTSESTQRTDWGKPSAECGRAATGRSSQAAR